jgi:tetratricopeptide (TPR) repeat protein
MQITQATALMSGSHSPEWIKLTGDVLSHAKTTAQSLAAVLGQNPVLPRALALKGLVALILGRSELRGGAVQALADARTALATDAGWPGDAYYIDALALWLDGKPLQAAYQFDAAMTRDPDDVLALKLGQSIRFMFGDFPGMLATSARQLSALGTSHMFSGYVHGMHAFALEEAGDFTRAEAQGRRAVELSPNDAWGRHAVAHVYEMTGKVEAGRRWLASPSHWAHCNNFGFHMWWHLALFEMERGNLRETLSLYDRMIRAQPTDDYRDVANAASLLARLEFEGVNVGGRWQELGLIASARVDDHSTVFADLHYLLSLLGTKDLANARKLVDSLAVEGDGPGETSRVIHDSGLALAQATLAFAEGRYGTAVDLLIPSRERWSRIGGSKAQRDVFDQMLIEAAMRSGRHGTAERLLKERIAQRGGFNQFALARLYKLGQSRMIQDHTRLAALAATQAPLAPVH